MSRFNVHESIPSRGISRVDGAPAGAPAPAVQAPPESAEGFALGGTASAQHTTLVGADGGVLHRESLELMGVATRQGAGTVRSFDVAARGDVTSMHASASQKSGEATLGLNTANYRFTASAGTAPSLSLPVMARLGVERRMDVGSADTRFGWDARLGYFRVNEPASPLTGTVFQPDSNILAAGVTARLSTEKEWRGLHLSGAYALGLDAFGRVAMPGPYRDHTIDSFNTSAPIDTLAGLGGLKGAMYTAVSYDVAAGDWIVRPMVTHTAQAELTDPTIAPEIMADSAAAGARVFTPYGVSLAGAAEASLKPTRERNLALQWQGVGAADVALGRGLRFSATARLGAGSRSGTAGLVLAPTDNLAVSAYGGYGSQAGTVVAGGLTVGFGERRRVRHGETTDTIDAARPYLDGRGQDRRYRPLAYSASDVTVETWSGRDKATVLPSYIGEPKRWLPLVDTPERLAAALDPALDFAGVAALPDGTVGDEGPSSMARHAWALAVLRHHRIEAQLVEVGVEDQPATVVLYRDPKTKMWRALYGNSISYTDASTPEKALQNFAAGMGEGVRPRFMLEPPRDALFGIDRKAAMAARKGMTSEDSADLSLWQRDLGTLSYDQLVARARELGSKNPEHLVEGVAALLAKHGVIQYAFHGSIWRKLTPEETWNGKTGVCADYAILGARLLREGGVNAVPIQLFSPGRAHDVIAVQDPRTGLWDIINYDTRFHVGAKSPEAAAATYDPTYYRITILGDGGRLPLQHAVWYSPEAQEMRDFMRRLR